MDKMRKVVYITICIILLIIVLYLICIFINSKKKSEKAVLLAKDFLENKYTQEMIYDDIKTYLESNTYDVYFHLKDNPEIRFYVEVGRKNILDKTEITENVHKELINGYKASADDFLFSYFSYYVEDSYEKIVNKTLPYKHSVYILASSLFGDGHAIPKNASEQMSVEELENIWDYSLICRVLIDDMDSLSAESEKNKMAAQILDCYNEFKTADYNPNEIVFEIYDSEETRSEAIMSNNYLKIVIDNCSEVTLEQIILQMDA